MLNLKSKGDDVVAHRVNAAFGRTPGQMYLQVFLIFIDVMQL